MGPRFGLNDLIHDEGVRTPAGRRTVRGHRKELHPRRGGGGELQALDVGGGGRGIQTWVSGDVAFRGKMAFRAERDEKSGGDFREMFWRPIFYVNERGVLIQTQPARPPTSVSETPRVTTYGALTPTESLD